MADEWKGYYDRAFSGEQLDFTIKSSVQGEGSWRQYIINLIRTAAGEIVGASCLSRDISKKVRHEQQGAKKDAVLQALSKKPATAFLVLDENSNMLVPNQHIRKFIPEISQPLEEGKGFLNCLQASGKALWKEYLQQAAEGATLEPEHSSSRKQGGQLHIQPLQNEQQEVLVILLSIYPL